MRGVVIFIVYESRRHCCDSLLDGYLLETYLNFCEKHIFYGRFEHIATEHLLEHSTSCHLAVLDVHHSSNGHKEPIFKVAKVGTGYTYQLPAYNHVQASLGFLVNVHFVPQGLKSTYGLHPVSYFLFLRIELI